MVIAYHAIWTTYGTWLPNDPRGSYSKAAYSAALRALGEVKYGRQAPQPDWEVLQRFRAAATPRLSRPRYFITEATRPVVAAALGRLSRAMGLAVRACSIMDDHVHLVVMRSRFRIEYVMNQLKGAGTRALAAGRTPWTRNGWKVFLDDMEAVYAAMRYVEANPPAAGPPPQQWDFVEPLPPGA